MNNLRRVRFRFEKIIEDAGRRFKMPSLRILRVKRSNNDGRIIFLDSVVMGRWGTASPLTLTLTPKCAQYLLSHLVKELEKLKGGFNDGIQKSIYEEE